MPRPIHFELHADDPERAIEFYRRVFGWRAERWEGPVEYWMLVTGDDAEPGINGGLMRRMDPEDSTANIISVSSVDEYQTKITAAGGSVIMPKMPLPGVGFLAYFKDPEGNVFGVLQADPTALESNWD